MTIGSFDLKMRPVRIGFLVNPTKRESVNKAIRLNSILWGGMFNPLIPCYKKLSNNWEDSKSKHTTASKVIRGYIEGFDPDYLINVSEIASTSIEFNSNRIVNYSEIISSLDKDMTLNIGVSIFEVLEKFKHDEMRFVRRNEYKLLNPMLSSNYRLFLSSIFGDTEDYKKTIYDDILDGIDNIKEDVDINNYWTYFSQDYLYARRIGAFYLEQHLLGPVIFYMDATKVLDVIDYWNMRAAGLEVYPVAKQTKKEDGLIEACKKLIKKSFKPYHDFKTSFHRVSIIKSRNTTDRELTEFSNKLKIEPDPTEGPKYFLQRWYPRYWDEWARRNTQETIMPAYSKEKEIELQEGQTILRFKTLNPDFDLNKVHSINHRFAIEVNSRIYGNDELLAEVIPQGGDKIARTVGRISIDEWRISKTGPVYLSRYKDWTVHYEIPKAVNVMTAWFKEQGWDVNISPAGKIANQMITQLGGLWGIIHLKEEKLIKLLHELSNNGFINEHDFKGRISQITNSAEIRLSRDEYIKNLLEKEVFQLGVELKCPICTQRSWHSLKEVDSKVRCGSCLSDYKIQSIEMSDKKWAYKSFGTFGLPKQAYGAFGVLLTLNYLVKDNDERATTLLSFIAKKGNKDLEADLCLVTEKEYSDNATQELVFAECKTYNKFETKDIKRMSELAKEFPGSILVFSTLRGELTSTEKRLTQT
ncbi:MAG: hypothetical protein ABW124_14885, partial [Candidatus Thiodiazotropha sp. 6PLUC9]